jgi:hypothetical protein
MNLGCVNEYPQLISSDNFQRVSLLWLVEDIKERSGARYPLIPQFAGERMGDPL